MVDLAPVERRGRRERVAVVVGELTSPPYLAFGLLLLVTVRNAESWQQALTWGAVAALFASLLPLVVLLHRVRRGVVADRDVRRREQRPALLVMATVSVLVGVGLLVALDAPRELLALLGAMTAGLLVALGISMVWKISIHVAVAAGTVAILALLYGPLLLLGLLVVVLVAWSRLVLTHHTRAQVIVGALVGLLVAGGVYPALLGGATS
ncbi:phosphatase PAP2 family protein [Vallicoccus soli]|uniref:Phosphoesterase PA-phosphatase n=1 Tax=Vallicoccus soli TaxID=2339232 RepID=A0A3A3YYT1_9ACTN|nr:phosphatase PAP2 family protein [Vallicoccus soli]RJK95910.1 phosphoesterase PA-phosphatase [Vallicoccus soli]